MPVGPWYSITLLEIIYSKFRTTLGYTESGLSNHFSNTKLGAYSLLCNFVHLYFILYIVYVSLLVLTL
jgi:hypothetical protein